MTETNSSPDLLDIEDAKPGVPSTINVLTILTFIGCGFSALVLIIYPFIIGFAKKAIDKSESMADNLSSKELERMEKTRAVMDLWEKNMALLLAVSFVGIVLCLVGAIWMRKLRKDGFWLYVAGELLPIVVSFIILGNAQFTGWTSYLNFVVPVVFIALYAGQMKHMK